MPAVPATHCSTCLAEFEETDPYITVSMHKTRAAGHGGTERVRDDTKPQDTSYYCSFGCMQLALQADWRRRDYRNRKGRTFEQERPRDMITTVEAAAEARDPMQPQWDLWEPWADVMAVAADGYVIRPRDPTFRPDERPDPRRPH